MDVVVILIFIAIALWVVFWRQRQIMQTYTKAQREVLDRQQQALTMQTESVQLLRETTRLLDVIAKALAHSSQ